MAHAGLKVLARAKVREALRATRNVGYLESFRLANSLDDDVMEAALEMATPETRAELTAVGGLGDGALLEKFLGFLNSDLGKSLVTILVRLLTGA